MREHLGGSNPSLSATGRLELLRQGTGHRVGDADLDGLVWVAPRLPRYGWSALLSVTIDLVPGLGLSTLRVREAGSASAYRRDPIERGEASGTASGTPRPSSRARE